MVAIMHYSLPTTSENPRGFLLDLCALIEDCITQPLL